MRALVTGSAGFVGSHLIAQLLSQNWRVFGFDLRASRLIADNFIGELADAPALRAALERARPQIVFHLAGVIRSDDAKVLFESNVLGTVNLLQALVNSNMKAHVVITSSSAVYGAGRSRTPIRESTRLRPVTAYAASKAAQETAALQYFASKQLPVTIVRMFNLLGPGQPPDLACSNFARQIAMAERDQKDEVRAGSLTAQRDFVDVRDAARAIALVAERGKPGEIYNLCSGKAVQIGKCLQTLLRIAARPLSVHVDAGLIQKNDVPIQVGDPQKIKRAVNWRPRIALKESLADLLNDWRQKVKLSAE